MRRLSKMPKDPNQAAALTVKMATDEAVGTEQRTEVSRYLSEIGRRGGIKGGKARADALSAKKRKEIAKQASAARWSAEKKRQK
jgi:hypothetical protein